MTATAIVSMQSDGPVQRGRALLDTGADLTLITRKFANALCAKRISNKSIEFNSAQGVGRTLYEVRVTLIGDDRVGCQEERVNIIANVVESLSPMSFPYDMAKIRKMPFVQGLPLADPTVGNLANLDLIVDIGAFYLCRRHISKPCSIPSIATDKTIFGWIIGGANPTTGEGKL